MTTALVLQHGDADGLGPLSGWLQEAGVRIERCRRYPPHDETMRTAASHDALIVLGGLQNANDHDDGQGAEIAVIAGFLAERKPILGICLGHQLLALAAGGEVGPNANGLEAGHGLVRKGDVAAQDPIFRSVPFLPDVIQWHSDEVRTLPPGAVQLCRGEHTEHQAFRVGDCAWGVQFHPEADEDSLRRWAASAGVDVDTVLPLPADVDMERTWRPMVEAFARVARGGFTGQLLSGGGGGGVP